MLAAVVPTLRLVFGRLLQQNVVSINRINPKSPGREGVETICISQNRMKGVKEMGAHSLRRQRDIV